MTEPTPCPLRQDLERYSLGRLAEGEADAHDRHVGGCPRCLATLRELTCRPDALVEALRTGPSLVEDADERQEVADLIDRLKGLSASTAAASPDTGATADESYDFLAPPQAADQFEAMSQPPDTGLTHDVVCAQLALAKKIRLQKTKARRAWCVGCRACHRSARSTLSELRRLSYPGLRPGRPPTSPARRCRKPSGRSSTAGRPTRLPTRPMACRGNRSRRQPSLNCWTGSPPTTCTASGRPARRSGRKYCEPTGTRNTRSRAPRVDQHGPAGRA